MKMAGAAAEAGMPPGSLKRGCAVMLASWRGMAMTGRLARRLRFGVVASCELGC
jgi:hypothetical protein